MGVNIKEYSDTEAIDQLLLKGDLPPVDGMPAQIQPKGLDAKRKWYLFEEILPFISCPIFPNPRGLVYLLMRTLTRVTMMMLLLPLLLNVAEDRAGVFAVAVHVVQAEDVNMQIRYVFNNNCLF